eukprot:1161613-Pelagomonas_calceolata.AAC.9
MAVATMSQQHKSRSSSAAPSYQRGESPEWFIAINLKGARTEQAGLRRAMGGVQQIIVFPEGWPVRKIYGEPSQMALEKNGWRSNLQQLIIPSLIS